MKLKLSHKIFFVFTLIILLNLSLVAYLFEVQVVHHFKVMFSNFIEKGIPLRPLQKPEFFFDAVRTSILWTAFGAIGFSALLAYLASYYFAKPIQSLIQASKKIADGRYDTRVNLDEHDELGDLAHAFNAMAHELEKNDQMQQELIDNLAHELASPLTNIRGYTELLIQTKQESEQEKYQHIVEKEIQRLDTMIHEMRKLSQIHLPQEAFELKDLCLAHLCQQSLEHYRTLHPEYVWEHEIEEKMNKTIVRIDEKKWQQALENLFSNAMKYSEKGSKIHMKIKNQRGDWRLELTDEGTGIDAEELPFVFHRFYRTEKSRNQKTGGLGIGLHLVKKFIQGMNGDIWIQSKKKQGTKVIVHFPIIEEKA